MELFVVNRHANQEDVVEGDVNEQTNLDRVLKRIERNKKIRMRQKEKKKVKSSHYEDEQQEEQQETKAPEVAPEENDLIVDDINDLDQIHNEKKKEEKYPDPSSLEGFTVLGEKSFDKKEKVKRVLPKWLANPAVLSMNLQDLQMKVSAVKELDRELRHKLKENGIKYFFPVQAEVIPWLIKAHQHADVMFPRDVCVSAPTGSGKTLAFVLPIIQALKKRFVRKARALIILPTQNLAIQIFGTFQKYMQNTNLTVCLLTGQKPFAVEQSTLIYKNEAFGYMSKADILVCTAGRLVEHIKSTKGFDLSGLEFLVIDEADRVLENVQNDWLYHLEKHIYTGQNSKPSKILNLCTLEKRRPPQKLLFSATLSQDPEKLQMLSLFQPKLFTSVAEAEGTEDLVKNDLSTEKFIGKYITPRELTEKYMVCSLDLKPLVLYYYIKTEDLKKVLVFTHSIDSAHRLKILLKLLFKEYRKIEEISSSLETNYRNKQMENFSNGNIDILICTDSLARGVDLVNVQCVISYSAPKYLETYIHRVGRTARAGELGLAVTILHNSQFNQFQSLLKEADKNLEEIKISETELEPLGDQYRKALGNLKEAILTEDKMDLDKIKAVKRQCTGWRRNRNMNAKKIK